MVEGKESKKMKDKREISREKRQRLHVFFYIQNLG